MTCNDCIHKPVCYRADSVSPSYADKCGDFAFEKTGHWIEHKNNGMNYIECSKCLCWFLRFHLRRNSYCPNCGARMVESEE